MPFLWKWIVCMVLWPEKKHLSGMISGSTKGSRHFLFISELMQRPDYCCCYGRLRVFSVDSICP
jgi:hypothetical protein